MKQPKTVRDAHLEAITQRYEGLYTSIVDEVTTLSPDERAALIASCKELTRSNCSWLMYRAADLIRAAFPYDEWFGVQA